MAYSDPPTLYEGADVHFPVDHTEAYYLDVSTPTGRVVLAAQSVQGASLTARKDTFQALVDAIVASGIALIGAQQIFSASRDVTPSTGPAPHPHPGPHLL